MLLELELRDVPLDEAVFMLLELSTDEVLLELLTDEVLLELLELI